MINSNKFKIFENEYQIGNYVKYNDKISKIENIETSKHDHLIYTLRQIIDNNVVKLESHFSGIKIEANILSQLGFNKINSTDPDLIVFNKDELFLADLTKFTNPHGWSKYCIYDVDKFSMNGFSNYYSMIKEKSFAIFHIHALQNYVNKHPNLVKIEFDKIVMTDAKLKE